MMWQIVVRGADGAWLLQSGAETVRCPTGAEAERRARALARQRAATGEPTAVAVFDLAGRPVGRLTYPGVQ
jgi:hypothetical protein